MKETTFKDILQDLPPGEYLNVPDVVYETTQGMFSDKTIIAIKKPELHLHCDSESCKGVRLFEYNQFPMHYDHREIEFGDTSYDHVYIEYLCQNCKENVKSFAIIVLNIHEDNSTADIIKFGEFPFYGPHIPSKLISLIGPDREIFIKGLKCESQKFGIAAFAYYRRVIENQKERLIDNISKVLSNLNVDKSVLELLQNAKDENQFKTSMDKLKPYLPNELLIDNYNPLVLLHKSLSIGLHSLSDDECLKHARNIRLVLTELSVRLKALLSDKKELQEALHNLNKLKG